MLIIVFAYFLCASPENLFMQDARHWAVPPCSFEIFLIFPNFLLITSSNILPEKQSEGEMHLLLR